MHCESCGEYTINNRVFCPPCEDDFISESLDTLDMLVSASEFEASEMGL